MNLSINPVGAETTVSWYQTLKKPFFAPPSWVFGVAWGILYPIILISFGYVFYQVFKRQIPAKIALPFVLNLLFNLTFSPIQFGLQNNFLAAVDITLTVTTLIWGMKAIYPFSTTVALAQIPYLLWGLFATVLQYAVTILNW
jgi:benzodiazapine receptor